jgi:hypothetical protein
MAKAKRVTDSEIVRAFAMFTAEVAKYAEYGGQLDELEQAMRIVSQTFRDYLKYQREA